MAKNQTQKFKRVFTVKKAYTCDKNSLATTGTRFLHMTLTYTYASMCDK